MGIRRIPRGAREGTRPAGAGAAGDLLEGAGGVVVLVGQDCPLAREEQFSRPGRYPGAGEAVEELPLGRDLAEALDGIRALTASPRASRPRTISLPTRPVAPITAVVLVSRLCKTPAVSTTSVLNR